MKTKNAKRNLVLLFSLLIIGLVTISMSQSEKKYTKKSTSVAVVNVHKALISNAKCGDGIQQYFTKTRRFLFNFVFSKESSIQCQTKDQSP